MSLDNDESGQLSNKGAEVVECVKEICLIVRENNNLGGEVIELEEKLRGGVDRKWAEVLSAMEESRVVEQAFN